MSDAAKIVLSAPELIIAMDTEWILTKQAIIGKVFEMFNGQVPFIKDNLKNVRGFNDAFVSTSVPRIFKGENYRQLPYVTLDYPAVFKGEDIFAVRTMFWWGNFFSIVLLLSGKYLEEHKLMLMQRLRSNPGDFYVCIGESPWEHHFGENNFVRANKIDQVTSLPVNFLKLGLKYDLQHWNNMPSLLGEGVEAISKLFGSNSPGGEKDL